MLLHAVRDAGVCNRASGQTNKTNVEPSVGTVRRNKRTKTNQIKRIQPKKKCVGVPVSPSKCCRRDAATSRRSKRGRTDPEMAVTS